MRIILQTPQECGDEASFFEAIRSRTARVRLADESEDGLELRVRLSRTGKQVRGELRIVEKQGATDTRVVRDQVCEEVLDALALTAVLAVDQRAIAMDPVGPSPSATEKQPPTVKPKASKPTTEPRTQPLPESYPQDVTGGPTAMAAPVRSTYTLALGGQVVAAQVVKPTVSLGVGVVLRGAWTEHDTLEPSLSMAVVHAPTDGAQPRKDVAVRWTGAVLSGCPLGWKLGGGIQFHPCAMAAGGWLAVSSRTAAHPITVRRSWWVYGLLARGAVAVGEKTTLELDGALSVRLVHRSFITRNPDSTAGEIPMISWICGLGLVRTW